MSVNFSTDFSEQVSDYSTWCIFHTSIKTTFMNTLNVNLTSTWPGQKIHIRLTLSGKCPCYKMVRVIFRRCMPVWLQIMLVKELSPIHVFTNLHPAHPWVKKSYCKWWLARKKKNYLRMMRRTSPRLCFSRH